MSLVELRGVSKRMKLPRILTEEEFGALLNELVHPYHSMVLLAGCTGLRVSEVIGLRWTGINFEALAMEVREGLCSQPSHVVEIGMLPGRIASGSGRRQHFARMEEALPRGRERADGLMESMGNRLFEDRFPWGAILVLSNFHFFTVGR